MNTYLYRASFYDKDLLADGTVEAESEDSARAEIYGRCGDWYESGADHRWSFTAGCPDYVTIEELVDGSMK